MSKLLKGERPRAYMESIMKISSAVLVRFTVRSVVKLVVRRLAKSWCAVRFVVKLVVRRPVKFSIVNSTVLLASFV
jgi:hypothetical protein